MDLAELDRTLGRLVAQNKQIVYPAAMLLEMFFLLNLAILFIVLIFPTKRTDILSRRIITKVGFKYFAFQSTISILLLYIFTFIRYGQMGQFFALVNGVIYAMLAFFSYFFPARFQHQLLSFIRGLKLLFVSVLIFIYSNTVSTLARAIKQERDVTFHVVCVASSLALLLFQFLGGFQCLISGDAGRTIAQQIPPQSNANLKQD